ncbi:cell division protein ZapA [Roseobacter sp. HKCCD9010]|jgi:cell division protein ZapA|uniref:cell division protein ZapA n=1 Tax=Rhodobacterales TaxID=204455 RepID=UPI001199A6D1|nr:MULTISPECIES: cell division protein ZapA [Rhodobacterales]MBF9049983.1 cell division protein ZapA [Rhodobacterales bacterium HKCCD4356]NNV12226.1 cell division protein ZapA [Roseobacter sp. HKCCD7357]NNV16311.1 cell division protein ZapA [Roseobacter sp. HKCCD8768]NNV25771.1 cell division protein ZapA [Roseobacter sp. HKCCD8192]NNV30027.1 cell division protein ZapA [Roseobacter sp. HKCCD9061]
MPELNIEIGGRSFTVACQEGEEPFLEAAARMLDTEAAVVLGQIGRMPPERMLLMAGLMLADKTAGLEEDLGRIQGELEAAEAALTAAQNKLDDRARRIVELEDSAPPAEITVIPAQVTDGLAELAARAEALAEEVESAAG